jgi:predicted glycosyltransferase
VTVRESKSTLIAMSAGGGRTKKHLIEDYIRAVDIRSP